MAGIEVADADLIVGDITLEEMKFADGAYSDVYKGDWIPAGQGEKKKVAVKMLRNTFVNPQQRAVWVKRFERELSTWRTLDHPNLVKFLGVSAMLTLSPSPGLVSPYYKNSTIMQFLKEHADELDYSKRAYLLPLITGVADGLQYLHTFTIGDIEHSIIHGDLKPNNILIDDSGRKALICDFGQCRIIGKKGYTTKLGANTRYLAPEVLRGECEEETVLSEDDAPPLLNKLLSLQSDVYAFGVTALEIISGSVPFRRLNDMAIIHKVAGGKTLEYGDYSKVDEDLWKELRPCWAPDKSDRPTMLQVTNGLRALPQS